MKFQTQIKILIVLLLTIQLSRSVLPQDPTRLEDYREEALTNIQNIFTQNANSLGDHLLEIYQNVYIKDQFSKSGSTGLGELECEKILKKIDFPSITIVQKYYLSKIVSEQCNKTIDIQSQPKILEFEKDFVQSIKSDQLRDIYYGFQGIYQFYLRQSTDGKINAQNEKILVESCDKLANLLQQDGTGKYSRRSDNYSYYYSAHIYEIYDICFQIKDTQVFQQKIANTLKVPMLSTLLNTFEIEQSQLIILDRDINTLETTARILHSFVNILKRIGLTHLKQVKDSFESEYQIKMIRYLKNQEDSLLESSERYYLTKFYKTNSNDLPQLFLRPMAILGSKKFSEIPFRWENLMGGGIDQNQAQILNKNLNFVLRDRQGKIVQRNLEIAANAQNEKWNWKAKVQSSNLQELGYFQLDIAYKNEQIVEQQNTDQAQQQQQQQEQLQPYQQWNLNERIYFVNKVKCNNMQFEVTDDSNLPKEYSNQLKEYEKILMPVQASGDRNFIHFKFTLDFERNKDFVPRQVGVALIHPNNGETTTIVQAKYDSLNKVYRVKMNLSSPDVMLPYNNTYDAQLMVSDQRLRENISWKFAKFQIKFKSPKQDKPYKDTDYVQLSQLEHTFNEPQKKTPLIFVGFYCIIILIVLFGFLASLKALGVNSELFPTSSSMASIFNYAFIAYLAFMLLILGYFWVFINLQELVILLLVVTLPFYIIGSYAISYLPSIVKQD